MQFVNNIDLNFNQLLNAKLQVLASDPGSPVEGQLWYNSTSKTLKFRTNAATIILGTLDQISAPTTDVAMATHKITGLGDPTNPQDAATRAYLLARALSDFTGSIASDINLNSHKLTNVTNGSSAGDAVNFGQLSALSAGGGDMKESVRLATTSAAPGNVTIASPGAITIDGVTPASGDRILLRNQTAGAENGIYIWNGTGSAMTRAGDADTSAEVTSGMLVPVAEGTTNGDSLWMLVTNDPITLGTTTILFSILGVAGATFRKFVQDIGDGTTTSFTVTHNLGTRDCMVTVRGGATPWALVYPDISFPTANTVQLDFAVAPTTNQYHVTIGG